MPEEPIPTLPDDTKHGPVPPMGPMPINPDPGRKPMPNPEKVGDNPVMPPARKPFPEPDEIVPPASHPKSLGSTTYGAAAGG
jgi:hypothetical protein